MTRKQLLKRVAIGGVVLGVWSVALMAMDSGSTLAGTTPTPKTSTAAVPAKPATPAATPKPSKVGVNPSKAPK